MIMCTAVKMPACSRSPPSSLLITGAPNKNPLMSPSSWSAPTHSLLFCPRTFLSTLEGWGHRWLPLPPGEQRDVSRSAEERRDHDLVVGSWSFPGGFYPLLIPLLAGPSKRSLLFWRCPFWWTRQKRALLLALGMGGSSSER